MGGKHGSQDTGIVLHSFFLQIIHINLILALIGKFDQKSNFQPRLFCTKP